jgi:hypothetical protein
MPMTVKKTLLNLTLWALGAMALQVPARASDIPQISDPLKKMLGALPIDGVKDQVHALVPALKKTSCGGGLSGCYMTKSGELQLYYFTDGKLQETFMLVLDKKMTMPTLLKAKVQKVLGGTSLQQPIISISTSDYVLDTSKMPADLQAVVKKSYFGVANLEFAAGVQLAARASLAGLLRMQLLAMNVDVDNLTMRAGVSVPIPLDLTSAAGTGAGLGVAMHQGDTFKKASADALKPGAYVEFQFGPGSVINLPMPRATLTDTTIFIDNELVFGYKGNAVFAGTTKKTLLQFQTPLTPEGGMDLLDFSFVMATPASYTLADATNMMIAMSVPDPRLAKYGGGFVKDIDQFKSMLKTVEYPLTMIQLRNPHPAPEYKFGDATKPFPTDAKVFNVTLYGPLADGGPYIHLGGDVTIVGAKMGSLDASAGTSGLHAKAMEQLYVKLGPLGKVTIEKVIASADIDKDTQRIRLKGNFGGQVVEVILDGEKLHIDVPANCVNPFEIKATLKLEPSTDLAKVFDAQGGVNVDPSSIAGCIGADLEKALNKIAGEYKNLGGYTAHAATQQLNKIRNGTNQAYNTAKNGARDAASKTSNAAMSAFNDAGNAFKRIGKKKKHHKGPDPKFAASVFDWDDYYDNAPDVVAAKVDLATHWREYGFNEGRQGSLMFSAAYYWNRYADVQALCPGRNLPCALQHWLDTGLDQGRQGSEDFSVRDYLNRYPDLVAAFGRDNFPDAMEHWSNYGEDEGRNGAPQTPFNGTLAGTVASGGGDGGGLWSDGEVCSPGQYVDGFRVGYGKEVNAVQFRYAGRWAARQGASKTDKWADIALNPGEAITRVDFRAGDRVNQVTFTTSQGRVFGPYGGNDANATSFTLPPGEKLGCVYGRAGSSIDRLYFPSTGLR